MATNGNVYPPIRTNRCKRNPSKYIPITNASPANANEVRLKVPNVLIESRSMVK